MPLIAHIGNIPVEEWVPFVAPVVAVYIFVRRKERRRREAVGRLPDASQALDQATIDRVLAGWSEAKHTDVSHEHLPLLYPPGPDGMSPAELATRVCSDPAAVERLLEQLEDLEYLELEDREGSGDPRVSLTFKGYELVDATEAALLAALGHDSPRPVAETAEHNL